MISNSSINSKGDSYALNMSSEQASTAANKSNQGRYLPKRRCQPRPRRPPHAPSAHEKTNGTSCGLIARGRDAGACAEPSSLAPGICTRALPKVQKRGHLLKFFYYFFYCFMFIKLHVLLYHLHVYMLQNWFPMLQFLSSRLHIQ